MKDQMTTRTIEEVDNGYDNLLSRTSAKLVEITSDFDGKEYKIYMIHVDEVGAHQRGHWVNEFNGKSWKTLATAQRKFNIVKSVIGGK